MSFGQRSAHDNYIQVNKMAAAVEARTCGSCCLKLKELVNSYEEELGLKGKEFDGTKSKYSDDYTFFFIISKSC